MIDAAEAQALLALWLVLVGAHAAWRSLARPEPDRVRPAGPIA